MRRAAARREFRKPVRVEDVVTAIRGNGVGRWDALSSGN
jgi:hypothetical protein